MFFAQNPLLLGQFSADFFPAEKGGTLPHPEMETCAASLFPGGKINNDPGISVPVLWLRGCSQAFELWHFPENYFFILAIIIDPQ